TQPQAASAPVGGTASFTAEGGGPFPDPIITGQAHLRAFRYNELPLGDFDTRPNAPWRFRGVRVDIPVVDARSGRSTFVARNGYLDFSRWVLSAGMHIASDSFFLRDYYHMFKLENDPVWEAYGGQTMPRCAVSLAARARACEVPCVDPGDPGEHDPRRVTVPAGTNTGHIETDVTFVLGRPGDDPAGVMDVDLTGRNLYLTGFDEALDHTDLRFHFTWAHRNRGFQGSRQNVEYVRGRFAGGTIDVSGNVDLGGQMHFMGNVHNVQVARTQTLRASGVGGVLNASGVLEGQPDAQRWSIDGDVRSLTAASRNLGDAFFHVRSRPDGPRSPDPHARPPRNYWSMDATAIGNAMRIEGGLLVGWRGSAWRDVDGVTHADWDRDWAHSLVDGHLEMTRAIDLVPLLPARFASRLGAEAHATVRARVDIDHAILGDFTHANARLDVTDLDVGAQGLRLALAPTETLAACVHDGAYWIEPAAATSAAACERIPDALRARPPAITQSAAAAPSARFVGPEGTRLAVSGGGTVAGRLALTLDGQLDLARLAVLAPGVTWARGTGTFQVRATGDTANPELRGVFELHNGALAADVLPDPVEDIDLRVRLDGTDIVLDRAVAAFGSSSINLTGGVAHLAGRGLDRVDVPVRVQNLSLVPMPGVEVALDANTRLLWNPGEALPLFSGDVTLTRVRYARPVNLSQDPSGETRVAGSDSAETPYDPANDHVRLNLTIHAREPIRVANNIAEAEVTIAENDRPFRVVGTDQRTGVIGTLNIPRGRVILPLFRGTDFEIVRGRIEFENPERIEPNFDVSAQTDVRRGGAQVSRNQWRVALHAYGRPDRFALDMTSEPALSRDDIALLLTFGATRAELDQAGAESVGQAIAVQALATATGIDRTLRQAIPVIDEFRIGSAYSPSQGRTVPQVAIGRRLNDRVRVVATVNTTETREMRANVDVRVSDHTSMQLGYDNINDQGSSQIGNLGADVRWRLEFE
ncbi:MAG: translocation/assembly module TamB domain-containing protein, partial [Deltaproteobacteria bacterium]